MRLVDTIVHLQERLATWKDCEYKREHEELLAFLLELQERRTTDAVEVVRCKGCTHYNTSGCADGFGWCEKHNRGEMDEHFCSNGERKDGEQNEDS